MKSLFSFFSLPYIRHNCKAHGVVDYVFFCQCWMLSVLSARRIFDRVELVTDDAGKALLVDTLGLQFDRVSLELNAIQDIPAELWAYGKIIAYGLQEEPFLHIDYDAFLFQPLPERLKTARVIAESREDFREFTFYTPIHLFLKEEGYVSPYFKRTAGIRHAFNCGVFGGCDLRFIRSYCREAEKIVSFIRQRPETFAALAPVHRHLFSIVFEQSNLAGCLDFHRISPFLFVGHKGTADIAGYTHLKGAKQDARIVRKVGARLERDFPDEWRRFLYNSILANPLNKKYMHDQYNERSSAQ